MSERVQECRYVWIREVMNFSTDISSERRNEKSKQKSKSGLKKREKRLKLEWVGSKYHRRNKTEPSSTVQYSTPHHNTQHISYFYYFSYQPGASPFYPL